jgi:hypothetical protein
MTDVPLGASPHLPWFVSLMVDESTRRQPATALEAAMWAALRRALRDQRHPLRRRLFAYYAPLEDGARTSAER